MTQQPDETAIVQDEPKKEKKQSDWTPVQIPNGLRDRIDKISKGMGFRSRAEYVRVVLLKQVELDEAERRTVSDVGGEDAGTESETKGV